MIWIRPGSPKVMDKYQIFKFALIRNYLSLEVAEAVKRADIALTFCDFGFDGRQGHLRTQVDISTLERISNGAFRFSCSPCDISQRQTITVEFDEIVVNSRLVASRKFNDFMCLEKFAYWVTWSTKFIDSFKKGLSRALFLLNRWSAQRRFNLTCS